MDLYPKKYPIKAPHFYGILREERIMALN